MTTDLSKLADALISDTPERQLEERLQRDKDEILKALSEGREYELDRERGIVLQPV